MVEKFIEMHAEFTENGRRPRGNPDLSIFNSENCTAVLHNHQKGRIISTIFKINLPQAEIDRIVASHSDHSQFTEREVQLRGLEIRSGTATDTEIKELIRRIKKTINLDLSTCNSLESNKSWDTYLRENTRSIGKGYWMCEHPEHKSSEKVKTDEKCSLGHEEFNEYAIRHIKPFDITDWKNIND